MQAFKVIALIGASAQARDFDTIADLIDKRIDKIKNLDGDEQEDFEGMVSDECCRLYSQANFEGKMQEHCLSSSQSPEDASDINMRYLRDVGSIKCGKKVDATICPQGYEKGPVAGQRELKYTCDSGSVSIEKGTKVGANQEFCHLDVDAQTQPSIILSRHFWVAKGEHYLSLDREDKADILWDKITADRSIGSKVDLGGLFTNNMNEPFDEIGDEMDCREKIVHQQGNVAKVQWIDFEEHDYTGIFQGADTGFVRLSTQSPVIKPGEDLGEAAFPFQPTMALKFLRDGMDSANIVANQNFAGGQNSYDFFKPSLHTVLEVPEDFDKASLHDNPVAVEVKEASNFIGSVGVSELSQYNQDGEKEQEPNFPYSLRFEPNEHLSYDDEDYSMSVFERLSEIEKGTVLYYVYAMDMPKSLGGEEQLIGAIISTSELTTSLWGDKHLFFRHQRHDDDFRYKPEWGHETLHMLNELEEYNLRPYQQRRPSACPFSFLFEMV